ncbi:MAG: ATP-binding protein [Rhizonema sp. PD38]|nr:ATP-binding protein [Rhizonema sp. PD38]
MILKNKLSELQSFQVSTLQLEEELQLTKLLMEHLTDAVFWITPNGQVIYVNYAACTLEGYSYEELLSMTIHDVILDWTLEDWSNYWKTIKQQGSLSFESLHNTLKGQCFPVEITATYIKCEAKEYGCILIRDISKYKQASFSLHKANQVIECKAEEFLTKLKYVNQQLSHERAEFQWVKAKLENSLSLLQATLESTTDGIIAIGYDGDIVSLNQKFVQMWQIPDSMIASLDHNQYLSFYKDQVKNAKICCRDIYLVDNHRDFEICDTLELKNGRIFKRYSKSLRLGEEIIGVVWSFRDITECQQAKEETRRILEQEKQLAEYRSHFVSMVSHEFRSSLNIISYSTSLLKRHIHHWSEEKKLQYLQRLQTAVEQISRLMDEFLIIGSAEAGKLQCELKPLDLNLFCCEILAEMRLQTNGRYAFSFFSKGDCKAVWVDKKLLQSILTNLLSNAIKYSSMGSKVDLILFYEHEKVILQIKDRGIGISVLDQEQLFQPFYRGENVGDIPGNGLGLAIVKKLVDLHHSQINVTSEVGKGSTFTITLPLEQP